MLPAVQTAEIIMRYIISIMLSVVLPGVVTITDVHPTAVFRIPIFNMTTEPDKSQYPITVSVRFPAVWLESVRQKAGCKAYMGM